MLYDDLVFVNHHLITTHSYKILSHPSNRQQHHFRPPFSTSLCIVTQSLTVVDPDSRTNELCPMKR